VLGQQQATCFDHVFVDLEKMILWSEKVILII